MVKTRPGSGKPEASVWYAVPTIYICAVTLWMLSLVRVLRVPITVDEAPNRTDLALSYRDLISLKQVSANNHILNSILRKACVSLLGNTPFALRLPTLLAHAAFLLVCLALCRRLFRQPHWQLGAVLCLNLNPFLFEFWGYSRGYGLAIAFMTAAIYWMIVFIQDRTQFAVWLALLSGAVAVWSNFALLNFFLPLCAILLLEPAWFRRRLSGIFQTAPPVLLIAALLALLISGPIRKLRDAGELYYGGTTDVITNTVTSLAKESVHIPEPEALPVQIIVWSFIVLSTVTALGYVAGLLRKRSDAAFRTGGYFCLITGLVLLSLVVQHVLLGTKYLIDRTALFIIPLVVLMFIYALHLGGSRFPGTAFAMLVLFTGLNIYNFAGKLTLRKSHTWWLDNYNEVLVERLAKRATAMHRPLKLRVLWALMPSTDYYIYTRYPELFEPLEYNRDAPDMSDTGYDYLYFPYEDVESVAPVYGRDTVFEDNLYLYRRK